MESPNTTTAYLDNSATTQPCAEAITAVRQCLEREYYNPSAVYRPAVEEFQRIRTYRADLLGTLHAQDSCDLIFTSGGTEANNLAVIGTVSRMRGKQVVAVSAVEHPSVKESFDHLRQCGHDVRVIGVTGEGELRWEELERALEDGASFVSCMQVNNETGALLDVEKLARIVDHRAVVHVDGVQGYLRVPFDMRYADLYTLSGHKIHGPKGIGALVVRKGLHIAPRAIGGGQEGGLRSGTENTPGIAGLHAAAMRMYEAGDAMRTELMEKKLHLIEAFRAAVPELEINGPDPRLAAPHIVNLSFPDVRGEVMLHALEGECVYASTGSACSSKKRKVSGVLLAMGIDPARAESALRFSISPMTTIEEIDYAAQRVGALYQTLKRFKRR